MSSTAWGWVAGGFADQQALLDHVGALLDHLGALLTRTRLRTITSGNG